MKVEKNKVLTQRETAAGRAEPLSIPTHSTLHLVSQVPNATVRSRQSNMLSRFLLGKSAIL